MSTLKTSPITLGYISEYLDAELVGCADKVIIGLSTLHSASSDQLSFLANSKYIQSLKDTSAGALILSQKNLASCPCDALVMDDPYWGYARASRLFRNDDHQPGVHPAAIIADSATIPASASIAPGVVIEEGVVLGEGVIIGPGCVLGKHVRLGDECHLYANVTLYHGVEMGSQSIIHSGSVIGADGFGYAPHEGCWEKIEQFGSVRIGQGVEIGANTTIDRGALDDTVIGDGVIIDNQIQIGHNVVIGDYSAVASSTAIAGSTKIGRYCTIAGAVAIAGHVDIADNVHIKGMSMVSKSIAEPGVYASGTGGVMVNREWQKNAARFRKLNALVERVSVLEKKLSQANS
ncbi:MAG: UDP-3-O-(3-hydroxymyristoyl)glucosamine N-acyltransferase [Pseudomonadales bacterium]|nr:UDP-3-O-(3-hydroxymyristoyl)glucosamine N-acyltransferase [Pseudomonadales bacterium]